MVTVGNTVLPDAWAIEHYRIEPSVTMFVSGDLW